jgi:hypothetical protein
MRMDRSLFPRDHIWDRVTLINPFCPGPRYILPSTQLNHQYPGPYLSDIPYSGSAAFLEHEDFRTTRALVYGRLHLPTCCDSTEQLQRVLSLMPKETFHPTPAAKDMLKQRLTQLLSSHPRPLPYGVPMKVTRLRHYPYLLQDSALLHEGTVEEHLDMLIKEAEAEYEAGIDNVRLQDRLSELLVYQSRLQAATPTLIQPKVRPPAGALATPDGGLCCGNRSAPALFDSRRNTIVAQPHPAAGYAAGPPAVLYRPFTISGWP